MKPPSSSTTPGAISTAAAIASVFLRADVIAAGHDDRYIRRHVKAGLWHRIRRGAFVPTEIWDALTPEQRHLVRARAYILAARSDPVLSHVSAAAAHGAPIWDVDLESVHVSHVHGVAGRRDTDVVRHRGRLTEDEIVVVDGLAVVRADRAALEVTTMCGVEQALVIVCGLLHSGAATLDGLQAVCSDFHFWPGSLTTDLVLRLADPRLESVGETRSLYHFWRQHLPAPELQWEVRDEHGWVVGRLDFAWPDRKVWAEFDGAGKYHGHRRPGESIEDMVLREKRREDKIRELTGWVCVRISWADLYRPEEMAARIRRAFRTAAA